PRGRLRTARARSRRRSTLTADHSCEVGPVAGISGPLVECEGDMLADLQVSHARRARPRDRLSNARPDENGVRRGPQENHGVVDDRLLAEIARVDSDLDVS